MQAVEEDPSDLSFRARVWTSALNKQPDFARQSADARALSRNKSETHVVRKRPYRLNLADNEQREPSDNSFDQARARTSLDVAEDSFVLRPATSGHSRQENLGPRSKRSIARRQDQIPSHYQSSGVAAPQNPQGDELPDVAQQVRQKSLSGRITDMLHGHREIPTPDEAPNRFHSESRRLYRLSRKGHRASQQHMHSPEVDSDVLMRADSLMSRARRAFSTGTTRPAYVEHTRDGLPDHMRSARSRSGRSRSSEGNNRDAQNFEESRENFSGVNFHRDPFQAEREASGRHVLSTRQGQQVMPLDASGLSTNQRQWLGHRRSYVDWDPIRQLGRRSPRNFQPSETEHKTESSRSSTDTTRALRERVQDLEAQLVAASAENRQMASQLAGLRKENALNKNTSPILEDVIRKVRQHFETKERALRLTISAMAVDFESAIKTRNEALRALSNHTGRPVTVGSTVSGGSTRKRTSEDRKTRASSWGSLEGSTAARRLHELEELAGPKTTPKLAGSAAERPTDADEAGAAQPAGSRGSSEGEAAQNI